MASRVTRSDAARRLGVSRATVERLAAGGDLSPAAREGREFTYTAASAARAVTGDAAPCMKCWADSAARDGRAGSRADRYARLLAQRDSPGVAVCTLEQQAGPLARRCPRCGSATVHQLAAFCLACGDEERAS